MPINKYDLLSFNFSALTSNKGHTPKGMTWCDIWLRICSIKAFSWFSATLYVSILYSGISFKIRCVPSSKIIVWSIGCLLITLFKLISIFSKFISVSISIYICPDTPPKNIPLLRPIIYAFCNSVTGKISYIFFSSCVHPIICSTPSLFCLLAIILAIFSTERFWENSL